MSLDKHIKQGELQLHIGGAVVCLGLLAAGWFLGVQPMMAQTSEGESVVQRATRAERDADMAKSGLDKITKKLEDVREQLEQQPVSLASADEINPLLAQLASWAELHKLSITQTRAERSEAMRYYDYVPIKISGEGGYVDLLAFLKQMHEGRGDLGVTGFSIRRIQTADGPGVGFDLQLAWYVVGEQQEPQEDKEPATASALLGE